MAGVAARSLLLVLLGLVLTAVPISRVAACDCEGSALPDAIRDADVAVVATLIGRAPAGSLEPGPARPMEWTWQVERTRSPLVGDRITTQGWEGDSAMCGVSFEGGERWLVVATVHDGRLHTNGCMPNHLMDGTDPQTEALIADLLALEVEPAPPADGLSLPAPILIALLGLAGLAVVGGLAFRGADRTAGR